MNTAVCRSCDHPRYPGKPWLFRHTCTHCVEDFATRHRAETGHQVELNIITIERIRRRPDTRTTNLITRKNGW